jgi:hypothetical protein
LAGSYRRQALLVFLEVAVLVFLVTTAPALLVSAKLLLGGLAFAKQILK